MFAIKYNVRQLREAVRQLFEFAKWTSPDMDDMDDIEDDDDHYGSKLLLDKRFDHLDEHYGSKLLLAKLFHRAELGLLLPKLQVTLKIFF